jgi:anion transporter
LLALENFADTIRSIPFFSGLSREDLARVTGKLEEERYSSGQVIIKEGEDVDALYMVESGAVEVVLENGAHGAETLAMLSAYDCFGEMALFTGEKRSATVRAFVDATVLKLRKGDWEELLGKFPSLALHFCKVLSRRLADTDKDVLRGRGAFNLVMEEFFMAQTPEVRHFLTRTAQLKTLDVGAIQSTLSLADPGALLMSLSNSYPPFLKKDDKDRYAYNDYLRDYLTGKFRQTLGKDEQKQLHARYAAYFSERAQWLYAIEHYIKAEAWQDALQLIKRHSEQLLDNEPAQDVLALLQELPATVTKRYGYLARLRGQLHLRLENVQEAIHSYEEFLAHKQVSAVEAIEVARYYQELAELHRKKGELGEALACLQMAATRVEEGDGDLEAVEALRSIELLQQRRGSDEEAVTWGNKALRVAEKLKNAKAKSIFGWNKRVFGIALAFAVSLGLSNLPPQAPLDAKGVYFLALLLGIVILWAFEVFEEHVVAILLLLSWLVFEIVPTTIALAGFGEASWFFALGVLGIGAAVTKSGLLYRLALQLLRALPSNHKIYTFTLLTSGLIVTPLFPENKGRIGIMAPLTQTISEALGYPARSNGSAALAFSTLVGFTQLTFMFLTGATYCLVGWNVLPAPAKAEFGWGTWLMAALPAGILTVVLFFLAIQILFRVKTEQGRRLPSKTLQTQIAILGPLTSGEWTSVFVIALAAIGWLGKPLHGIGESWVALGAFGIFLVTGLLDKKGLKNNIDWGYLLFLGVVSALDDIILRLKVDSWLTGYIAPVVSAVSFSPVLFLFVVAGMVYGLRFLLKKPATVVLLLVTLTHMAQEIGIHPGVLLITILIAIEAWFLPYQTDSYQIAYYSTEEKAFSHAQGRKLMIVKFFVSFLTIAASVPYWRMLGFIR